MRGEETICSITTAAAPAAIATIEVYGPSAAKAVRGIFTGGRGGAEMEAGVHHGHITDGGETVDEVVVIVRGREDCSICAHGNPLIARRIVSLLGKKGVRCAGVEAFLMRRYADAPTLIHAEARIEALRAATAEGVRLIQHQVRGGLVTEIEAWERCGDVREIRERAAKVLDSSRRGWYLMREVYAVIAGPPNAGKSTLLNALTQKATALVTDTPGTTRDWVEASVRTGRVLMRVCDTAGLDSGLGRENPVDAESQRRSVERAARADVVLYVLDAMAGEDWSEAFGWLREDVMRRSGAAEVSQKSVFVLNKTDLAGVKAGEREACVGIPMVGISAMTGEGIEALAGAIHRALGVEGFDCERAAAFTQRQRVLIERIREASGMDEVKSCIRQLLKPAKSV